MKTVDYVNALPDVFRRDPESNNYKLLLMEQRLVDGLRNDIRDLDDILDISKATGKTLDLYGLFYEQARGSMTDEQYRIIILQKAGRYRSGGDHNSTVEALANALGVSPTEFELKEEDNPRRIVVKNLPYSILQKIGITAEQIYQIIKGFMPVGMPLGLLSLEGTFEFSALADEYDENAGFGDIDQLMGGHFGLLEAGDIDIPI